ncbi:MAG: hypothetical protein WBC91_24130 [Phototrophicaceae bacterium]
MLITNVQYIKPSIITAILRANTILADSEFVSKVSQTALEKTPHYRSYTFAVQYNDFRTQRHAPDHLQIKLGTKDAKDAKRELDFYERIARSMQQRSTAPLRFPTCYDAYYDDLSQQFHLILEGVSREYAVAKDSMPPTSRHREQLIDTLATLHAYWWEHPLLGDLSSLPTQETLTRHNAALQNKFTELKETVGKHLNPKHIELLAMIASGLPKSSQDRMLTGKGLTIIHGNLSPKTILYSLRDTMLINWQDWAISFGTDDLAMMIPLYWSKQLRDFQEKPLLKRYYDGLIKANVQDYSWQMLNYDYKASLAHIIGKFLLQWTWNKHSRGHWRMMEIAIENFILMEGTSIYI